MARAIFSQNLYSIDPRRRVEKHYKLSVNELNSYHSLPLFYLYLTIPGHTKLHVEECELLARSLCDVVGRQGFRDTCKRWIILNGAFRRIVNPEGRSVEIGENSSRRTISQMNKPLLPCDFM